MFVLLGITFAIAVISAYFVLIITDWLERRANKKFSVGKFKEE